MKSVTNPLSQVIYNNQPRAQQAPSFHVEKEPFPLDVVAYSYAVVIALIWPNTKQAIVSQIQISHTATRQIKAVTVWLQEQGYNIIHRRSIIKGAYERV